MKEGTLHELEPNGVTYTTYQVKYDFQSDKTKDVLSHKQVPIQKVKNINGFRFEAANT